MNQVAKIEDAPKRSLVLKFAERYGVDGEKLLSTLKNTAFKQKDGEVTNEQMVALLVVADQYKLNPFTKEIYAYPDKHNGVVPVVGVDGWSRIINDNDKLDGIEFEYSEETVQHKGKTCHIWIDCLIYRKDRAKPIKVREYFSEVVRELNYKTPWDSHPNRMHRHKALIQCARLAFGFAGIYDQDEAERIIEKDVTTESSVEKTLPNMPDEELDNRLESWRGLIESGNKSPDDIISMVGTKYALSEKQVELIRSLEPIETEEE